MIKIGIKSIILSESRYITESKKCTKMTFLYKKKSDLHSKLHQYRH